ncbi:MAG: hypothetical protein V7723_02030 [Sneathiella sp.]|uniref:hypothetical protein n=1 Tax=Sneathiella sp. TaxID=1964365 RepID=UPI0030039E4A
MMKIVVFLSDFLLVRGLAMFKQLALLGVFTLCFAGFAQATTVSGNFSGTIDAPRLATGSLVTTGGSPINWLGGRRPVMRRTELKTATQAL